MKSAMQAFPHQCLIAEIRYDDTPIPVAATSASSDKLAQRNIAWIDGPNPGVVASRRMVHPVQLRPTLPNSLAPDELMIFWGSTPADSTAQLYLPALDAAHQRSRRISTRSSSCNWWTPTPSRASRAASRFCPFPRGSRWRPACFQSTCRPESKRAIRTMTSLVSAVDGRESAPLSPPPPVIQVQTAPTGPRPLSVNPPNQAIWQRVAGAFTFTINISTKQKLLLPERRLLAVLRWMLSVTPSNRRWYPVLERYIGDVVGRVAGFGGDPAKIPPSETGDVPGFPLLPERPTHGGTRHRGARLETTGKIDGVVHDHFGDFSGFILETEFGRHHHYRSRESAMQEVVEKARRERIRVTVISEPHRPFVPLELILRHGGR